MKSKSLQKPPSSRRDKFLFFAGIILGSTGLVSAAVMLALGMVYGLGTAASLSRVRETSFESAVTGLCRGVGFWNGASGSRARGSLKFHLHRGRYRRSDERGVGLGRWLGVGGTSSLLTSAGTAICGGSAIAAMAPILKATEEEMAASLGTVFLLNSIALFLFPRIGWAIHDTSSVVGAAGKYGSVALTEGTTVKLVRALWIVPLCALTATLKQRSGSIQWPWFILFFCAAAAAKTYVPFFDPAYPLLARLGRIGLTLTFFLIGSGVTRDTLRVVGFRPFLHGLTLWAIVASGSLALIRIGWIHM